MTFNVCLKCGKISAWFIKRGKSRCKQRSVADYGKLILYSHQILDKWNEVLPDTIEGDVAIQMIATKIDINHEAEIRMR